MAIVSVREIWEGRWAEYTDRLDRAYNRVFRVITDAANTDSIAAEFANGLPRVWQTFAEGGGNFDPGAIVRKVRAEQQSDPLEWRVVVEYSTRSADPALVQAGGVVGGNPTGSNGGSEPVSDNPMDEPIQISFGAVHDTLVVQKTADTIPLPIMNSAKQLFSPRPTRDWNRPTLTVVRNEENFTADYMEVWDTVNSEPFSEFGPRQVKLKHTTQVRAFRNGYLYWPTTFIFEIRFPDWDLRPIDQGPAVRNANGKLVPVVDGLPIAGVIMLNGDGKERPPATLATLGPYELGPFKIYPEYDFNLFGLDL